jgi:hypothetical protein
MMQHCISPRPASLIVFLALAALGCSKTKDGRLKVYPTSGKVTANGQPVEGAKVVFYGTTPDLSPQGTAPPVGQTDSSGEFRLRTYDPEDGAPVGKFNVTVYWPEPLPPDADTEKYQRKDRFKGRYIDPQKSGLTAKVPEGGGELPPIEL